MYLRYSLWSLGTFIQVHIGLYYNCIIIIIVIIIIT
jgi:hypothetical protein